MAYLPKLYLYSYSCKSALNITNWFFLKSAINSILFSPDIYYMRQLEAPGIGGDGGHWPSTPRPNWRDVDGDASYVVYTALFLIIFHPQSFEHELIRRPSFHLSNLTF